MPALARISGKRRGGPCKPVLRLAFVVLERPSPCETHPRREPNEESPERPQCGFHFWLFGAVWGGRSVASTFRPSVLPAESMARLIDLRQKLLCRESKEESPESRRLFGAGLGAAAVRLPHFSPQRTPRGNMTKPRGLRKNALPPRRRLRSPRSFVLRRDRHKKTRKPEVNQQSLITVRHSRTY